jgi:hypothetical protein
MKDLLDLEDLKTSPTRRYGDYLRESMSRQCSKDDPYEDNYE